MTLTLAITYLNKITGSSF